MDSKYLFWNNINSNNFILFIRDLSDKIETNIKNLIDDSFKINNKKSKKNSKPKKKDLIIQEQNLRRYNENIKLDLQRVNYLINDLDINNIYKHLYSIQTKEGKIEYKCCILEKLYTAKKKNLKLILSIYFQIANEKYNKKYETLINSIEDKFQKDEYDFKLYMLKELGDILPPLNYWDNPDKKLEDWQINTLNYIKQNKSILVRAPTSSGKSFIALSAGVLHNKVIYICPSVPVVYQVGSHFKKMGKNIQYLIEGHKYLLNDKGNIYIGTPKYIEDYIYKIGNNFDYAVFDEIHNLNNKDGNIYENLIKIFNCNFVALSATIKNINFLKDIFNKIHNNSKKIELIEYNNRFINNQKWVWNNNKLIKLNPISCLNKSAINELVDSNISFTPNDCAVIWESLDNIIEEYGDEELENLIENISPDNVFNDKDNKSLLTLNDCKKYEELLKENIVKINKINPIVIDKLLNEYNIEYISPKTEDSILKMLRKLKKSKMLPMLLFNPDEDICENLFDYIYNKLHLNELVDYPYYYIILEKKDKLYNEYINNRQTFIDNIKISKNSKNTKNILDDKIDNFDKTEKNKFITNIIQFYENCIEKINKNNHINKEKQLKYINKELLEFIDNPDFSKPDIFKKHPDYCFTDNEPMDANSIKKIRKEIHQSLGLNISYENPIFQMLKRGIGIYTENMPQEYKWIIQKLLADRLIGVVITDRTLCQGIDLPIKTSCIYGDKNTIFTKDDILQISGRAGRRGHDTSGNVIYYNIDNFREYIFNENPEIIGSTVSISSNYNLLETISKIKVNNVFDNLIHKNRKIIDDPEINNYFIINWLLRYITIIQNNNLDILQSDINKLNDNFEKEIQFIDFFNNDIIFIYKNNKINDNIKKNLIKLKQLSNICIILYNNLNRKEYYNIKIVIKNVFIKLKNIILKHNNILK